MPYTLYADALLVLHFLFIIFVVLGGLLILKWRWMIFIHLPAATWGALIEFYGWVCPLTPWEQHLRKVANEASYETGFLEHYLMPLIYPANLNYDMQVMLGSFVVITNLIIYGVTAWISLRKTHRKA